MLSMTLVVGVGVHSMQASNMGMKAVASATDMPMHGKCSGCAGDEKAIGPSACSVYCGTIGALQTVPVVFGAVAVDIFKPSDQSFMTGYSTPPDPYPPRPAILT